MLRFAKAASCSPFASLPKFPTDTPADLEGCPEYLPVKGEPWFFYVLVTLAFALMVLPLPAFLIWWIWWF
jgi:hypothetical protein